MIVEGIGLLEVIHFGDGGLFPRDDLGNRLLLVIQLKLRVAAVLIYQVEAVAIASGGDGIPVWGSAYRKLVKDGFVLEDFAKFPFHTVVEDNGIDGLF